MARTSTVLAATLALAVTGSALAQMPRMFGEDAPKVGDALPDVSVYTDTGDSLRMSALKGKYTVLVFGCLT